MLKITPIKSSIQFLPVFKKNSDVKKEENNKTSNDKKILMGTAALALAGVAAYAITKNINKSKTTKPDSVNNLMNELKKQMDEFPQDIEYRKKIAKAFGIEDAKLPSLRSIIGAEEYKNILREFNDSPIHYTPGEELITEFQDNYLLIGEINKTYRATMHMHTKNSDGKITVQKLLDDCAQYADEIFEASKNNNEIKAKHAPFTLAITDHDTVEGCKEAVKIISANPEKYKNLRVVLGCEMTVTNRLLGESVLKRPVENHIIANCINPFDEKLNNFLDSRKQAKIPVGKEVFKECFEKILELNPEFARELSYEDAAKNSTLLKNGLLNVHCPINQYFERKIMSKNFKAEEKQQLLQEIHKITDKQVPKMDKSPLDTDFKDVVELFENNDGYLTLAHPALTNMADFLKNPANSIASIKTIFQLFKTHAGEKALAAEIYYPYFGEVGKSKEWLSLMETSAKENNLYFTGGLDSHGKNIFFSNF